MAILLRSPLKIIKKAVKSISISSPINIASNQFGITFGTPQAVSYKQLIENSETIPQIFSITNYVTDKMAGIPRKVVNASGKDAPGSELNKLIENPNSYQSFTELMKLSMGYYELTGNSYLYGIKPDGFAQAGIFAVPQLYCLPVEKTLVILKHNRSLPTWMNEVLGYQCTIGGVIYNLPAENVLHERYFSLRYDNGLWVYGVSKYIPGDKMVRELKAIHNAKTSIIEHRGPTGFITNDSENPDPEQTKSALEKLKENYGVLDDQDKIMATSEKLRWVQMGLGIAELQLIENAKYSFEQLCNLNGISPVVFASDQTYANQATAEKKFMLQVVKPRVDNWYKQISTFINNGKKGDRIIADWAQVEEMQEDRKALTDVLIKQIEYSLITPRKAQEELYGDLGLSDDQLPPDEYMRSTRLVPFIDTNQGVEIDPLTGLPIAPSKTPPEATVGAGGTKPLTAADVQAIFDANSNQNGN